MSTKMEENPSKTTPRRGFSLDRPKSMIFPRIFSTSCAPRGGFWRHLGSEKRPKLETEIGKNRSRNLLVFFFRISINFGWLNRAKLRFKSNQKQCSCLNLPKVEKPPKSLCFSMILMVLGIGNSTKINKQSIKKRTSNTASIRNVFFFSLNFDCFRSSN